MNRAYSLLTVKAVSEDKRVITGVATTPTPDRVGDIVEPLGVKFRNPMPLLHQHRSDQPVGTVRFDKATKDGITFEARLPKIEVDGPLKDRVDTAWEEIKAGLVRGVSIGFRSLEESFMDDGGIRFIESEVLELSLVTIPANADAVIQTIKTFDAQALAASGNEGVSVNLDGDSFSKEQVRQIIEKVTDPASRDTSVKPKPKTSEKPKMQTTQERVKAFEAKRSAKAARMATIMEEAGDATLEPDASEEYDTIKEEVKAIDEHLVRLNDQLAMESKAARPVEGTTPNDAAESRGYAPRVSVKSPQLPKGIAFGRYVRCKALGHAMHRAPEEIAAKMYPNHDELQMVLKTDIPAANVATSLWAGALVGSETNIFADFVEYLRPMTIIGQFGTNGIPSLKRVPFRTPLITQSATTTAYWVGEGQPKPMSKAGFTRTTLLPYKAAALTAATMELLRDSSPNAEAIIRDDIAKSVATKLDTDFLDPQKGLESGVSPASISNGVTAINSSGRDADSVRADLVSVMATYVAANNSPSSGVWVMSAITALQLSLLTNALGQPEFPGMMMSGGRLQGLPVITSEYVAYTFDSPTEGRDVFLVNANDIYFGDEGGIDVRMSTEASLEMEDAPANASAPTVAQGGMTSMFQTNSVAFLAERTVGWARRRTEAVVWLAQVEWGEASGVNV
jgi:HK97 family phage major capsid protein/HK97 family phage prohead protease